MVRKRSPYTRARAKRGRPKTPAPTTGWRISELAQLTQIPRRKLRYYLEHRLIVPTEFRGTATRYQRRDALRALGVARLRADTGAKLSDIKRKLDALGDAELEAWLCTRALPPTAAAALGLPSAPAAGVTLPSPTVQPDVVKNASTWQRIGLLPGLELLIAADASPIVLRAAQRICEECLGAAAQAS